jgi:competence protein ComEA
LPTDAHISDLPAEVDLAETLPEQCSQAESTFWLRRKDQLTVTAIAVILFGVFAVSWVANDLTDQANVVERSENYRIDLNSASEIEIAELKGIGPTLAQRIVESRESDGPFTSVDDLIRVNGIGKKKLEANRSWIFVAPR